MASAISDTDRTIDLLGGQHSFSKPITTALEAHREILASFPGTALTHLTGQMSVMRHSDMLEKVVAVSLRSLQRQKIGKKHRRLSKEQSGRAWKFASILARASSVFGTQQRA